MAGSSKPGPLNPPMGYCRIPARTPGPLGMRDQGDPSVTTLLGDTPGPLGFKDWASPNLSSLFDLDVSQLGAQVVAKDGTPLSLGSLGPVCHGIPSVVTVLDWEQVRADIANWEGKVTHMYLDHLGYVTVGIGKMLPDAASAKLLSFIRRTDKVYASAGEIEADFNEVSNQMAGMKAYNYKKYTKLDLSEDDIYRILDLVIKDCESELNSNFIGYKTYPIPARRALLDMIYNLGIGKLLKYKKLKDAVEVGDWKTSAKECHRNGPPVERNEWTKNLFLEAAKSGS